MTRVTVIALFMALVASLVWHYSPKRTEPRRLIESMQTEPIESVPASTDAIAPQPLAPDPERLKSLQEELAQAQSRLASLQETLDQAMAANTTPENPRALEVETRIKQIEGELQALAQEHPITVGNAAAVGREPPPPPAFDGASPEFQETAARREELQNELADLRTEQSFWKQRAQEGSVPGVDGSQTEELRRQVSDQRKVVARLRDQYAQESARAE